MGEKVSCYIVISFLNLPTAFHCNFVYGAVAEALLIQIPLF